MYHKYMYVYIYIYIYIYQQRFPYSGIGKPPIPLHLGRLLSPLSVHVIWKTLISDISRVFLGIPLTTKVTTCWSLIVI